MEKPGNVSRLCAIFLILVFTPPASAEIPWGYRQIARDYRIPAQVLYAIALTESGKRLPGKTRPWPWTLNVRGRSERYPTRLAAFNALNRYLQQGVTLIDVGLMQVNWHWHHARLGTPWEALDPYHNLRVGADILLEQFALSGDWRTAIGRYHSPGNPGHAERYRKLVDARLKRLAGG